MVMATAVYWPRGYTQAPTTPEKSNGREEARRLNDHEVRRDGSYYRKHINQMQDDRQDKGRRKTNVTSLDD